MEVNLFILLSTLIFLLYVYIKLDYLVKSYLSKRYKKYKDYFNK